MENFEPKKLALLRIWQILREYSDYDHPMTQEDIANHLEKDYGIVIERKAISRNISLLKEAGIPIDSGRNGSLLEYRDFEDSELHMLIDAVLCSRYITASHSKSLIKRLCRLSNKYFRFNASNIYSIDDLSKTDNQSLFYNIELIDSAIRRGKQLHYNYNKYGIDKKLHKTSRQYVSPYRMILHNQRYYLMAYSEYWHNMVFHRLDHITDMKVVDEPATKLGSIPGYENGIDMKNITSAMPYMYTDAPVQIDFIADAAITDQIVDWFGKDAKMTECADPDKIRVSIKSSPNAMELWAMQYINHVEIVSPESLRKQITEDLRKGLAMYSE